jgi:hypothetical protein
MLSLERKFFHKLSQLKAAKTYSIKFGDKSYHYSEIQLFFVSLEAVEHFKKSKEHYLQTHSFQVSNPRSNYLLWAERFAFLLNN